MISLWVSGFCFGVALCHLVGGSKIWGVGLLLLSLLNFWMFYGKL